MRRPAATSAGRRPAGRRAPYSNSNSITSSSHIQ